MTFSAEYMHDEERDRWYVFLKCRYDNGSSETMSIRCRDYSHAMRMIAAYEGA